MKKNLLIVLTITLTAFIGSENGFDSALIPTKDGAVLAFTNDSKSFTINLVSEKIEPLEQRNFVLVDNWIFQAFVLDFENPKNVDLTQESEQKKALSQYVMYEIEYFKKELGYACDSLKFKWGSLNDKYFYFWHFNAPKELKTLKKQMYLTTICHNQFLNLNIPLDTASAFQDGKDFLFSVAKTLVVKNEPIDFQELYNELNK
jgi:hypothetical protein